MKAFTAVAPILMVSVLTALAGAAAAQQAYPSKPIRFIIPFAPGGTTDALTRLVGQKLTESWGQPAMVDHRPGGNAMIGTEIVAKSSPDGYTILQTSIAHVIITQLLAAPYDPIKDFAPVGTLASTVFILVLHPSVPANNLQELIALAKSKPGQLNYGSAGTGGMSHLGIELFSSMAGVTLQHIPYKGTGASLIDLLGGQVQLAFQGAVIVASHIKTGKLKAIATTGTTRLSALPQVPTFIEAGLPGYQLKNWIGVLAPAGTPKGIIDKLSTEIAKIMAMSDTKETLVSQGMDPLISTPEQLAAMMKADMAKFGKIIKTANIKPG